MEIDIKKILEYLKSKNGEDDDGFKKFKQSLPENLSKTPNSHYDLRYAWRNSGKPKDFMEAISMEQPMFTLEDDGTYHGMSVQGNTGRFLKPSNHPTIQKELDWYNSNNPDAVEFRKKYDLDKSGKYYKYVLKKQNS